MKRGTPRKPRIVRLSPTMKGAIEMARENGGRLILSYNNRWWQGKLTQSQYWHTKRTIQALVDRGLAKYTKWEWQWEDYPFGQVTEVTLIEQPKVVITAKADEV